MNLSPRNKLILVGVGCLLGIGLLAGLLVVPSVQRLGSLDTEIQDAANESDAASLLLEQRRQVKDQATDTSTKLLQLSVAVPETPEMPSLIIDLQDTARESGVIIKAVTPSPPVATEGVPYMELPLQVEVHGTWADTVEFLHRMRRLTRQFRLVTVTSTLLAAPVETPGVDTGLTFPPFYQVQTLISTNAYMIPASSLADTAPAEAAPVEPVQ